MALNCPQAAVEAACINDLEVMADPASPQGQTLTQFRSQLSNDLQDGELKGGTEVLGRNNALNHVGVDLSKHFWRTCLKGTKSVIDTRPLFNQII